MYPPVPLLQVTPGYGCGQPPRRKEGIGAWLLAGWCKDFLRVQEGSAVQQVTKGEWLEAEQAEHSTGSGS